MNTIIDHIIQVDDDAANNLLCKAILKRVLAEQSLDSIPFRDSSFKTTAINDTGPSLNSFIDPEEALNFIKAEYSNKVNTSVLLLLDINMPGMSGWEFLAEFNKFSDHIRDQFTIYILSSSVDLIDKKMAADWDMVAGFISKPLKKEALKNIFFHN